MRQMNTPNAAPDRPSWQLVLVLWGTKYPVDEVNHLIATILSHADPAPARIVLLSDRPRPGLDARADLRDIPAFFLQPAFLGSGCQAKLCLFEAGVLPDDMPAIFVDIDTVVWGNLARLLPLLTEARTVAILQSAVLPFGPVARWLHRVSRGRRYARGNSSVVVFHPAEGHHVASRFRDLVARHGPGGLRPMVADERFLSWANQPNMRAVPGDLIVKLPTEFMLPYRWMIHLRAALPWVRARRNRLIGVTLPGIEVKGETLLSLPEGAEIVDRKRRRLIWSDRCLGPVRNRLIAHYAGLDRLRRAAQDGAAQDGAAQDGAARQQPEGGLAEGPAPAPNTNPNAAGRPGTR